MARRKTTTTSSARSRAARSAGRKAARPAAAKRTAAAHLAAGKARTAPAKRSSSSRTAAAKAVSRSTGRSAGRTRPSGRAKWAGKSAQGGSAPPKRSAARERSAGRRRKDLDETVDETVDVTRDVQRRRDEEDENVPTPPSSLDMDRHASAARSGHGQLEHRRRQQNAVSPEISGGDVDADWMGGYFVGDEAATGDNPTPDQDSVEGMGRAVGVDYEDTEELKSTPKIDRRDKKRWELDPASAEDYKERNRKKGR